MLSIKSLKVDPIAGVLQEFSIRVNMGVPPCQDEGHWQGGVMESSLLWEESIPHYGLNGMG